MKSSHTKRRWLTTSALATAAAVALTAGAFAALTSSTTATQAVATGSGAIQFDTAGRASIQTPITNMRPGDSVQKIWTIENTATFNWGSGDINVNAAGSSVLTTATSDDGVDLALFQCSAPYSDVAALGPLSGGGPTFVSGNQTIYVAPANNKLVVSGLPFGVAIVYDINMNYVTAASGSSPIIIESDGFGTLPNNVPYFISVGDDFTKALTNPFKFGPLVATSSLPASALGPTSAAGSGGLPAATLNNVYSIPLNGAAQLAWTNDGNDPVAFVTVKSATGGPAVGVTGPTTRGLRPRGTNFVFDGLTNGQAYTFSFGSTSSNAQNNTALTLPVTPTTDPPKTYICPGTEQTVLAQSKVATLSSVSPAPLANMLLNPVAGQDGYFRSAVSLSLAASNAAAGQADAFTYEFQVNQ